MRSRPVTPQRTHPSECLWQCDQSFCIHPGVLFLHPLSLCQESSPQLSPAGWVLLSVHRNHRLIRDGRPGYATSTSTQLSTCGVAYICSFHGNKNLCVCNIEWSSRCKCKQHPSQKLVYSVCVCGCYQNWVMLKDTEMCFVWYIIKQLQLEKIIH